VEKTAQSFCGYIGNKLDAITTQQKEVVSVVFNPKNPKQWATVGEDRTLSGANFKRRVRIP
jgi:hypothetical protein